MRNENAVVGTFRLDGMLQGPIPPDAGALETWAMTAKRQGLHFHLSSDGSAFSIVADPAIEKVSRLQGKDLGVLLQEALVALLSLLPREVRNRVYSTVRSEEFRQGEAVQSLFGVALDGSVTSEQRVQSIATEAPAAEISVAALRKAVIPALMVLLVGLFVSSFFVDYEGMISSARDRVVPLSVEEVILDQSALEQCVSLEFIGVDSSRDLLMFEVSRGEAWQEAQSSTPQQSLADWPNFLRHLAIHRQRVELDLYNKAGVRLETLEVPLTAITETRDSTKVSLHVRLKDRLAKIVARP